MLSRRNFIHAGCAITASTLVPNFLDVAKARSIHGGGGSPSGNVNLNLSGAFYFEGGVPFINVLKTASAISIQNSNVAGVTYSSEIPKGSINLFGNPSAFDSYLDNNGDLLNSIPAGTITYSRILFSRTGGGPAVLVGSSMTLDWSGGAAGWTVQVNGSGVLASGTGTTPLTFTWPSGTTQITLFVTGSGANPPTQLRLYKTSSQSLINAGKFVDPGYLSILKTASNILRFAPSWMNSNGDTISTDISNMPAVANAGWTGAGNGWGTVNNNTNGVPLDVIVGTSIEANKHPWIAIPEGYTTPKMREIYSINRSSTPVVTTYGQHNFANGDTIIFTNWSPFAAALLLNPTSYSAGTFTTSGVNSIANDTAVVLGKLLDGTSDSSTYPTGITKGTVYWTINATSASFQLSATQGGSALSLSGSTTGTINVAENYQTASTYGQLVSLTSYASSVWTLASHGMVDGTPIVFGVGTGFPANSSTQDSSTYPSGITKGLTVYVKNATANTFQTSASPGGAAMTLSGSMTGTPHIYLKLAGNRFTVANTNPAAHTFEITGPGANTAGYNGLSKRGNYPGPGGVYAGHVVMPFNLATIDTVVAGLVNYIAPRLPSTLIPLWALSNEIWNSQSTFTAFWTLGAQIPDPTQYFNNDNFIKGYLQAAIAHSVYKAYGAPNRSKYRMVLEGNQTGNDLLGPFSGGSANGIAAGVLQYLTDFGGGLTVTNLFNHLSVTSYLGSVSYSDTGAPITATFGTNTMAFAGAVLGTPVKLNTNSPGGTLPTGLSAGVLGGSSYPSGSGPIYWLVGAGPNFGLATTPSGAPVSFTGGSGSNTATTVSADVIQFLMAQSISLNGSNPALYPNAYTYFDTAIAEDIYNGKWTNGLVSVGAAGNFTVLWNVSRYNYFINNYLAVGKQLAGLTLIAYEGGESNNPSSGNFPLLNDATWQAAYSFQQFGAGSATNFMQLYTAAVQTGLLTHQAQFVDVAPLTIAAGFGNFGAWRYVGDTNARAQGVIDANALN